MKEIINAVIQGVIQGLSEFLPVSSSGHLALFQHFTGNSGEAGFLLSVVLHLGTLAAVFAAFWKTVITLVKEFFIMCADIFRTVFKMEGNKFSWKKMNGPRRMLVMVIISTAMIVPFYIAVKPFEEKFLVNPDPIVIGVCFLITSFLLFISAARPIGYKEPRDIKLKDALIVGALQGVALLPGISRSGSTTSGGLICGFTREMAVRYAFILGIPTILAGSILEIKDAVASDEQFQIVPMAIGFVVAAVVGFLAIKLVRLLLKKDKFRIFAYYTLVLGVVVICAGVYEHIFGKPLFSTPSVWSS